MGRLATPTASFIWQYRSFWLHSELWPARMLVTRSSRRGKELKSKKPNRTGKELGYIFQGDFGLPLWGCWSVGLSKSETVGFNSCSCDQCTVLGPVHGISQLQLTFFNIIQHYYTIAVLFFEVFSLCLLTEPPHYQLSDALEKDVYLQCSMYCMTWIFWIAWIATPSFTLPHEWNSIC